MKGFSSPGYVLKSFLEFIINRAVHHKNGNLLDKKKLMCHQIHIEQNAVLKMTVTIWEVRFKFALKHQSYQYHLTSFLWFFLLYLVSSVYSKNCFFRSYKCTFLPKKDYITNYFPSIFSRFLDNLFRRAILYGCLHLRFLERTRMTILKTPYKQVSNG